MTKKEKGFRWFVSFMLACFLTIVIMGANAFGADGTLIPRYVLKTRNDSAFVVTGDLLDTLDIFHDGTNWIINGGASLFSIGDDVMRLGLGTNDNNKTFWFVNTSDSGGVRYNATKDSVEITHDGGVSWAVPGGGAGNAAISDSSITLLNATAWRMFFSNATATAIQELAFGTSGKVLTSGGASANPTWETPAVGGEWTSVGGDSSLQWFAAADTAIELRGSNDTSFITPGQNSVLVVGDPGLTEIQDSLLLPFGYIGELSEAESLLVTKNYVDGVGDVLRAEMADTAGERYDSAMTHLDGMAYDKPVITVTNASTDADSLLVSVTNIDAATDMVFRLDGVNSTLDCFPTAATVKVGAGSDANTPKKSYIYVTNSGGTATLASSDALPSGSFGWVGQVLVPDTTTFNAVGKYSFQRHTESFTNDNRGTESHAREKLRELGGQWASGVTPTLRIVTNGGAPDSVHLAVTSGIVRQLHRQTFPSFDNGPYHYGNGANIYEEITDLNAALLELDGVSSLSAKRFNLIIWGAVNVTTGDCKLFVNLPNGSYNNNDQAAEDRNNTADYTVPADMKSVAFLIARLVLRHQTASSGTWTAIENSPYSLLGVPLGSRTGGASAADASNEFDDNLFRIFDETDPTKLLAFQNSGITTGNTRTMTIPDASGTIILDTDTAAMLSGYFKESDTAAYTTDIEGLISDSTKVNKTYVFNLPDPNTLYGIDTQWSIDPVTTAALTITRIDVTLDADPATELDFDLKWADAFIGLANAAVIDELNTTNGVTTITSGFDDATVAAGKVIYVEFNVEPIAAITQISIKVTFDYD